ncbi:MAG: coenzyme F420-0:L-glutamate ligase [Candidatus Hadarchaeales archaeon]
MPDKKIEIIGLELPLVKKGDDISSQINKAVRRVGGLRSGDILVVSSKVVSLAEGRVIDLSDVRPSPTAKRLARRTGQPPEFVEVILREADRVLKVMKGAILTLKDGHVCANAGADMSNAAPGHAILWPKNPLYSSRKIMRSLCKKPAGVIIADSVVRPLRLGTVGQAIGWAGFSPVVDCRGQPDLYGKPLRITFRALADQIATAAQLVTGEGNEKRPAAVIRGLDVPTEKSGAAPVIPPERCLYCGVKGWVK